MTIDLSKLHLDWGSSSYKGKVYRSYNLALSVWKDGKNLKEPVIKLGKLSDSEVEKWRGILKALKSSDFFLTSFDDILVKKHYAYLDIAICNAIWNELDLDIIFKNNGKREVSIANVARILTINRSIEPAAKSKAPEWFRNTALPWILDVKPSEINPSRIFRELAVIEGYKDSICEYLFKKFSQSEPAAMKTLFYDLSSFSFEGTKCKLMKWGHCKGGFENHVVLALVTNKVGLPFYWEVLPGCTSDSSTITWLLESLKKKFKLEAIKEITFIFDRGMVSDNNLALLENDDIKYISAMDKNQIENITKINFEQFSSLLPEKVDSQADELPDFVKIKKDTYCREIKVEGNRRYILCFNPQLFIDQRKASEKALVNFKVYTSNLNAELLEAKKSRLKKATYNKFLKRAIKLKINNFADVILHKKHINLKDSISTIITYQAEVAVDDEKRVSAGRLDGFWLLVTNHFEKENNEFKIKTAEAIAPYRDKEIIEEAFKDIKSFVEVEPAFVWTESHVRAHYTTCVLSYLINKILTLRLHKNIGDTSSDIVTHIKLLKETSECQLDYIEVKNIEQRKLNITKTSEKQKDLLRRIGLSHLINREILDIANEKLNYA